MTMTASQPLKLHQTYTITYRTIMNRPATQTRTGQYLATDPDGKLVFGSTGLNHLLRLNASQIASITR